MSLTCGGRGPCCHIGYAHRHCEHCDTVVPITVQPHTHWPNYPWYQTYGAAYSGIGGQGQLNALANQFQLLQGGLNATEVPIDAGQQSSST